MSKNITIQEGGVAKSLTVDKLKTNLVGGGACNWVPEDETQLITKSITKNGTYKASSDGAYGYSKVVVNVAGGSVTGKGSDGNTHSYSTDDQGNIVDTVIPSSIKIVTAPTFTGPYGNRATIGFDGLVVKAYDGNNNPWTGDGQYPDGVIPNSELVFPVTVTEYDPDAPSSGGTPGSAGSSLDVTPLPNPFNFGSGMAYGYGTSINTLSKLCSIATGTKDQSAETYNFIIVAASAEPFSVTPPVGDTYAASQTTKDGKTVYHASVYGGTFSDSPLVPASYNTLSGSPDATNLGNIAWTMIYGNVTPPVPGGNQDVPVQWIRSDGVTLEDSFKITVVDTSGGGQANY